MICYLFAALCMLVSLTGCAGFELNQIQYSMSARGGQGSEVYNGSSNGKNSSANWGIQGSTTLIYQKIR